MDDTDFAGSPDWYRTSAEKIRRREARVGVVGLGYVGLPLALQAVEAGFEVVGLDVDEERLEAIRRSDTYLVDVDEGVIERANSTNRLSVTSDYAELREIDVLVLCVPTPLHGEAPDLSYVLAAAGAVAEHMQPHVLVSLESTTYPGTTEDILRPRLERSGLKAGVDFALVFSPERIDPGNSGFGVSNIPKVIGGFTTPCAELGEAFYSSIVSKVVRVSRPREAEMAKLLENTYRQVNIALANEFAMVAHELDIDIWEVIEAAATKPFGFQAFYPGVGIGGHCIAVDPVYLTWRIRELGRAPFRLVELAREVDDSVPRYITKRIGQALLNGGLLLKDSKILVLGITYKPDVADVRESRAIEIMQQLAEAGAHVSYNDPFQEKVTVEGIEYLSQDLSSALADADIVAILTHHSSYDWNLVVEQANLIFDARGVTRGIKDPKITLL